MQTKKTRVKIEKKIPANWIHCLFAMSQTGGSAKKRSGLRERVRKRASGAVGR